MLMLVIGFSAQAQETSYYTAYYTSLSEWNSYTNKYETVYKNTDVSIPVTMKGDVVSFQAKNAVIVKTFTSTYEEIKYDTYRVKRWEGYDVNTGADIVFDIVKFYDSGNIMLVVRYPNASPEYSLNYFVK